MNIAILGAGAMGGFFGGRLSEAGNAVSLIDVNDAHIAAIQQGGLRLETDEGARQVRLAAGRAETFEAPVDLLVVFTKAPQTLVALNSVRHLIGPQTWVLSLQNGLGVGERIAEIAPPEQVAIGMTNWPSDLKGPGHVSSHGAGEVRLWSLSGGADEAMRGLAEALSRAGLNAVADPQVMVAVWEKAAFNAAMNSIAATTGLTVGGMADSEDARALVWSVVEEAVRAARANGVEADESRVREAVLKAFAGHRAHKPSMLQDIENGRATEIESINGAIAARAAQAGVGVPVTEALARLVRAIEAASRVSKDRQF